MQRNFESAMLWNHPWSVLKKYSKVDKLLPQCVQGICTILNSPNCSRYGNLYASLRYYFRKSYETKQTRVPKKSTYRFGCDSLEKVNVVQEINVRTVFDCLVDKNIVISINQSTCTSTYVDIIVIINFSALD